MTFLRGKQRIAPVALSTLMLHILYARNMMGTKAFTGERHIIPYYLPSLQVAAAFHFAAHQQ